ncbi:MAG: polymer-forming cytoskeletal protein [Pseudomonadota bacterium]
MFSKSRVNDPGKDQQPSSEPPKAAEPMSTPKPSSDYSSSAPTAKPPASVLSSDLTVVGNLKTAGDIQIEGTVEGDIRAHLLTVGEGATVKGECMADDVVVNGRIIGKVRGLKVRLTSTARVEGDIIHKTIAIESGAHFEGSVQRQEDPLSSGGAKAAPKPAAAAPSAAAPAAAKA